MKTAIFTTLLCTILYAGLGTLNSSTNTISKHNQETKKALALLGK